MKIIPKTQKDFKWVSWTPQQIKEAGEKVIIQTKKDYEIIKVIPKEKRTFNNTIRALEDAGWIDGISAEYIAIFSQLSPKKTHREIAFKILEKFQNEVTDLVYDGDLYKAFKEYDPSQEKLSGPEKKMYDDTKRFFETSGFTVSLPKQKELKVIRKKIALFENKFSKNINDFSAKILCSDEDVKNLPQSIIDSLEIDKKTKKKIVTHNYAVYQAFMKFSDSDKKRRELSDAVSKKGGKENLALLSEILKLRHRMAKILGFKNYVEYQVFDRISKSQKNIMKFLEETALRMKPQYIHATKELNHYKEKCTGKKNDIVNYYDGAYYANKYSEELWKLDDKILREYFPFEHVFSEMTKLFGGLFGVSFKETKDFTLWTSDVRVFNLIEKGKVIGHLALDLYPREGKYSHVAHWGVMKGHNNYSNLNEYFAPFSIILGQFSKPSQSHPSLMSFREVESLFHEFGHACHHLLSRAGFKSQSGTAVDFDFAEVPSQLFEEWIFSEVVLKKLSFHYKTKKKLPKHYIERVVAKHKRNLITQYYYVFVDCLYDQKIHSGGSVNLQKLYKKFQNTYKLGSQSPESLRPADWDHLASDYGGSYYGYMYSLVIAYDFFSCFEKEGLFNKKRGKALRTVLEKGGSEDEMSYIKKFLGRVPNNKAFLRHLIKK